MKVAKDYEAEAAQCLEMAATALRREHSNYGEAERQMSRAQECIKYARQINCGQFKGEDF